ncbi:DUF6278 family protein [Kitasatospora sp. NPDC088346]|uniref:DUF6278 family protein n=1 Tax=Kitasatospora sp. NPDC088346 TaxID=3364073 RepID=UPI0037F37F8E
MGIRFFDRWRTPRRRRAAPAGDTPTAGGPHGTGNGTGNGAEHGSEDGTGGGTENGEDRQEAMAALFAECGLLRELAESEGLRLDDRADSLTALDQVLPRWRDDPEVSDWLGNDAGLYLGTVIRRSVPGARWRLAAHGRPLLVLPTGLELDVTTLGHSWADQGAPQLSAVYLAATDD